MSVFPEERVQGLAYLIDEDDILSGRKAFCIGMSDCFFLRFRVVDPSLTVHPIGEYFKPPCRGLTQQTWSVRLKLYRVIMEALNTKSLNSTYKRHKTIDFAEWEWLYFSHYFLDLPVEKKGTVTLRVNRLDGSKESCKIQTKKYALQFTTSAEISMLKAILGSTITVSARNGFPTAPKQLQASDNYLFTNQTAGNSEYVNAVLPDDDDPNSQNGYYFLWTHGTDKLRVTTQWEKVQITNQLVRDELRRCSRGDSSDKSLSEDDVDSITKIELGNDFQYDQAQFEILRLIGASHVSCVVLETMNGNWIVGALQNFSCEFVQERLKDNY